MQIKFRLFLITAIFFLIYTTFLFGQDIDTIEKAEDTVQIVHVAVLSHRGVEAVTKKWSATMEYLTESLEGYYFELVPLASLEEMKRAVEDESIDFVITSPTEYVDLEYKYGIYHIATLKNGRVGGGTTTKAGLVFTHAGREDINAWEDIREHSLMGVSPDDFGGWQMAWFELLEKGIDPYKDCSRVMFSPDGSHEAVVFNVLSGAVDVGTIRSGILESMIDKNLLDLDQLKIIDLKMYNDLFHSTKHYPGPPFSRLRHTSDVLSGEVAIALTHLSADSKAAMEGDYSGWSMPLDYSVVQDSLRVLKKPPYDGRENIIFHDVLKAYWKWMIAGIIFSIIVLLGLVYISILNRKLGRRTKDLRILSDSLEQQVEERTSSLKIKSIQLKESEERYRQERDNLNNILNSMTDGVSIISENYDIRYINPVLLSSQGEVENRKCYDYFHDLDSPCPWCKKNSLSPGESIQWEWTSAKNGYTYDLIDTLIMNSDGSFSMLEISRNITERKKSERELESYKKNLEKQFEERTLSLEKSNFNLIKSRQAVRFLLEDVNDTRKNLEVLNSNLERSNNDLEAFSHSVSHDLRSPLRAVLGFTSKLQHLLGDSVDPEALRLMKVIVENSTKMQQLISDLLAYSKVGSYNLSRDSIDMNQLAASVVSEFEPELKRENVVVSVLELPAAKGNYSMIRQVFVNLIGNAVKFSRENGEASITLGYLDKESSYYVQDNGEGFDNSFSEDVFKIFKRVTDNKDI